MNGWAIFEDNLKNVDHNRLHETAGKLI
jgi:hypothetical protein